MVIKCIYLSVALLLAGCVTESVVKQSFTSALPLTQEQILVQKAQAQAVVIPSENPKDYINLSWNQQSNYDGWRVSILTSANISQCESSWRVISNNITRPPVKFKMNKQEASRFYIGWYSNIYTGETGFIQ